MMHDTPATTALAPVPADWTARYLALLGIEQAAPSLDAFTRLVQAHVFAVPFENVTALLRRRDHPTGPVPPPDPAGLLAGWEQRAGGGVCFEIAMMVARLLTALGYRAHLVLGQISLPFGHNAVVVELDGRQYLVDLGNGAPIFEPIPLGEPFEVHRHGLSFRFRAGDTPHALIQDRMIDGAWNAHCLYSLLPAHDADRDAGYQHHHTPNASWVTGTLTMVRSTADAVYALRDTTLTRHTSGGKTTQSITDAHEFARMAADVYGLPALRIAEALAVRAAFAARATGATNAR